MSQNSKIKVNVNRQMQPENGVVIQNITIRPAVRTTQDIGKWRVALQHAEAIYGNRVQLYDLYEDIILDPVLSSLIEKRILGVTKCELQLLKNNGDVVEEMLPILRGRKFRELRKELLRYKFWGISVIEPMNKNGFDFFNVPRKHIRTKEAKIVYEQNGNDGIFYREPPYKNYVVEIGRYDDLGLLLKAAPYVIYKRGGFGDWAQFAEIFGMPFRIGKYAGYNETARVQLERALETMGSAAHVVIPEESNIEFIENKGTNNTGELYNMLRTACNEELAVLILGQTETTSKTAGKLGGNDATHEATEDAINLDDREDELAILNETILPILGHLGYPVKGCRFIHKTEDEKLTIKDKVEVYIKLRKELDMPVADDDIYADTGINKPSDYFVQKKAIEARKQQAPANEMITPKIKETAKDGAKLYIQGIDDPKMNFWDKLSMRLADFFDQAPKD